MLSSHAITIPFPGVIGTFMGRDALRLAVSALGLAPSDVALLPAYLCVEVLKPFLANCRVEFYDVGRDTAIDPAELERLLIRHQPKVVLFINYFGFLQPARAQIKDLCIRHGARLIEDCAHSLLTEGSGATGDWIIHSFRKILPLPDGGGLKVNNGSELPHPRFRPRIYADLLSLLIVIKSAVKVKSTTFSRAGLTSRAKLLAGAPCSPVEIPRLLPMSIFARRRMRRLDFAVVTARRRDDFQFWLEWSTQTEGVTPLFDRLPPGVCPMGFPALVRNREGVKSLLERRGLLVRTHWHLPESVGGEFVNSRWLAGQSLTMPLYPEFNAADRDRVSGVLRKSSEPGNGQGGC